MAVYSNQPAIVAKLISRGADVNVQVFSSAKGGTSAKYVNYCLLHYAASRGHEWMATLCELLKAKNISLDAFNSSGKLLDAIFSDSQILPYATPTGVPPLLFRTTPLLSD